MLRNYFFRLHYSGEKSGWTLEAEKQNEAIGL